ncbi:hypothetical protein N7466_011254 [Penicillium verhagenii]|uniref:uncharacterized protein n=1 Tax=Penicillium verhagenii TaxID=1562060 RepID=UPI0025453FB3|nr:uncharacterized protein N7466_011679 [Penicillium verhagenii]XP_057016375.1 uncharacterized protein N7466_011254 [Penicillium verhagenii]KAJ5915746.1 hypothetical protein N7466_011679 [Penicillium verhagenii]KAJ5917700.1 hypothetical protein N7466_011254 [Penicillium verhagenii]
MSRQPTPTDLRHHLSKLVTLKNAQAAMPAAMRNLPVMAIVAGGIIAKVTNGDNVIERHLLGKPSVEKEFIALPEPTTKDSWGQPATGLGGEHGQVASNSSHKK